MSTIADIFQQEIHLHRLLNHDINVPSLTEQFDKLFNHPLYQQTYNFLSPHQTYSLHDGYIKNFSQKKQINDFQIIFQIDSALIFQNQDDIGYMTDSEFQIKSTQSLREINNRRIHSCLIDKENKEIGFLVDEGSQLKIVCVSWQELSFIKGEEHFYKNTKKITP